MQLIWEVYLIKKITVNSENSGRILIPRNFATLPFNDVGKLCFSRAFLISQILFYRYSRNSREIFEFTFMWMHCFVKV